MNVFVHGCPGMGTTWFASMLTLCLFPGANVTEVNKHEGCNRLSAIQRTRVREQLERRIVTSGTPSPSVHAVIARHPATLKRRRMEEVRIWEAYYDAWAALSLIHANIRLFRFETLLVRGCTARHANHRIVKAYASASYAISGSSIGWKLFNYSGT